MTYTSSPMAMNWILISPLTCSAFASLLVYSAIFFYYFINGRSRVYRDTVSGVDTGSLDMLHDTGDQDIGTVAYGIDLDLLTL